MTQTLVTEYRLAKLLRIDRETLRRWAHSGFCPATTRLDRTRHYGTETIDRLLQQGARNFHQLPTTQALLSGMLKLLTTDETCQILSITLDSLGRQISIGNIAVIKLQGALRVCATSVQAYIEATNRKDILSRKLVMHILGITEWALSKTVQRGEVQCVEVPNDAHLRPVTQSSLYVLLQRLLPSWIPPEDWLKERLKDDRPLMAFDQLITYLGLHSDGREIHELIESRSLRYVQTPGGERRFSPVSADILLKRDGRISAVKIGNLFGVSRRTIHRWTAEGTLACPIHSHQADDYLYKPCLLALLARYLSPGIKPRTWYNWRMQCTTPLLGVMQCASLLNMSQWEVYSLIKAGVLRGIHVPGTKLALHVSNQQVQAVRRELEKRRQ